MSCNRCSECQGAYITVIFGYTIYKDGNDTALEVSRSQVHQCQQDVFSQGIFDIFVRCGIDLFQHTSQG